ncbi:MAG: purine-nucleoside phosphorylase [Geminicoccaceae bacterium]
MNDLLQAARAAREHAYAPYSNFRVGAALRTRSGRIVTGCNVENAAYPQSQCAEASAIGAMVTGGETEITEILVIGDGAELCTPCGGCRQRLAEFAEPGTPVHLAGDEGLRRTVTLAELLPLAFTGRNLDRTGDAVPGPAEVIRARAPGFAPAVGLVLGSGLGPVAESIEPVEVIPYDELPGFPLPGVEGHVGRLILGHLAGVPVACLAGRVHLYEGNPPSAVNVLLRTLRALGIHTVILTNAAGSLRPDLTPGSLVLVADHINLQGANPLVGSNDDAVGPRFPDMTGAYDAGHRQVLGRCAARLGIPLASGTYLGLLGPSFETPAEIRAYRSLGADLVGMSTVAETISARHAGLRVAALSLVTNLAAGLGTDTLSHDETLAAGQAGAGSIVRLLTAALPEMVDAVA